MSRRAVRAVAEPRWLRATCRHYMGCCDKLAAEAEAKGNTFMVRFWEGSRLIWEDRWRRGYD